ncbi:MAG: hypothetical protein D4S01_03080 [Dehalococcoidia bacterium]|nr:MAG: hypothetical protein D4S01_03080 [Dehalococcoidia bacterium]
MDNKVCDKHDKMVHKTELHWMLTGLVAIFTSIAGIVWIYNISTFATKESVDCVKNRMDRSDKLYERIDTKLGNINTYIRSRK